MMKLARKVVACLAASALEAEALLPLAAKAACSRSKPKMLDEGYPGRAFRIATVQCRALTLAQHTTITKCRSWTNVVHALGVRVR